MRKEFEENLKNGKVILVKENFDIKKYFCEVPEPKKPQKIPYAKPTLEAFFYNPSSAVQKTIMVSNSTDGWIQICRAIGRELKCRYYYFSMDNVGNLFESGDGVNKRIVYSIKEDKWIFHDAGEILPFENEGYYKKRKKSDRMNKQILMEYCEALNLDIFDDLFWRSKDEGLLYIIKNSRQT